MYQKLYQLAETRVVKSKSEIEKLLPKFLEKGHEGLVVRNKDGIYRHKLRSMNVQKLVQIKRGTFEIVGLKKVLCNKWFRQTRV